MKILITGACGMIGSKCANKLYEAGHTIIPVDNLSGGRISNLKEEVRDMLYFQDVSDPVWMDEIFKRAKPDAVLHCAAMAAEILSPHVRRNTLIQNALGSTTLINCCVNHGVELMSFTSSIAVYGRSTPPFLESQDPQPKDIYGLTKLYTEKDLEMAKDFFGLNYLVFRPHNVIGTGQNFSDAYRNVVAIHIRQALSGEPLTIFGDGLQTRSFTPVDYVSSVIAAGIENKSSWNQVYNVGYDQPYSVLDIAKMVSKAVGVPENFNHVPARAEAVHAHSDHSKVKSAFSEIPTNIPIEETIREMVAEARTITMSAPPKAEIEVAKNLPEVWK